MHRGVSTDVLMVLDVRLSSVLEQDLYYGAILGLHGVLQNLELGSYVLNRQI